jgi:glycosyltransferase involved in cell wall biosynthesis
MRILQQCIYFPPEVGGLESHAYYLCRELVRQGHEVEMLTSRSLPGLPRAEVMDGVTVSRSWFPSRNPIGWTLHTLGSVPAYLRRARSAEILHAQTFASALPAMIAKSRYNKPYVLTLHTSHFLRLAQKPHWRPILGRIIASADWLLAASEEIRDVALDIYPHPRAEALTNGVDTELFRPRAAALAAAERPALGEAAEQGGSPGPAWPLGPARLGGAVRRLIVPRRLFQKNGVEYLIRALPVIQREVEIEALLVGDGPERPRLEGLVRELGIEARVHFLGARPNHEMPGLYATAEVAIFPSLMEATSVAALEAMSCGLPVAASRVGGLPEIVDEVNGTLFRPADPEDLATRVVALLRRPDLAAAGEEGRRRVVEHWSLERLARRHLEIYRTLLSEKR